MTQWTKTDGQTVQIRLVWCSGCVYVAVVLWRYWHEYCTGRGKARSSVRGTYQGQINNTGCATPRRAPRTIAFRSWSPGARRPVMTTPKARRNLAKHKNEHAPHCAQAITRVVVTTCLTIYHYHQINRLTLQIV